MTNRAYRPKRETVALRRAIAALPRYAGEDVLILAPHRGVHPTPASLGIRHAGKFEYLSFAQARALLAKEGQS